MTIENAHTKGTETGSLVFSVDKQTVLTRGGDDTVKRAYLIINISDLKRVDELQYGIYGHLKSHWLCILVSRHFIRIQMLCSVQITNTWSQAQERYRKIVKGGWCLCKRRDWKR